MRKIAVIDAETDPFMYGRFPEPFIWGFYDGERYLQFTETDALVAYLEPLDYIVYAHNGGRFDYHFMLDHLIPYDDIKIISGRLAKFKIGCCELRDSYNIIPVPLAAYKKDDIDYAIFEESERHKPENWEKICAYLESDCVYLWDLVTSFIDEYGCHLTQATASMKTWQKMTKRKPPVSNIDYYEAFKRFYYGGRVQCFKKGLIELPFKTIDIKSAYPYAMLDAHPIGVEYDIIPSDEITTDHHELIVGNYFYTIYGVSRGALPLRGDDGSLMFPSDLESRRYYVTGWELLGAIQTDTIHSWHIVEIRHHYEYIDFSDYINYFYEKRKLAMAEGDIATTLFCKLLMNSLYGKFAANPENYSNFMVMSPDSIPMDNIKRGNILENNFDEIYHFSGMLGPWVLASQNILEEQQRYYNVATSASITGYIRAYLWKAICNSTGILYCDTDSIAATAFHGINFGKELGNWEVEGEFIRGAIGGKKLYSFEFTDEWFEKHCDENKKYSKWKMATKGVRLTPSEINDICKGKTVQYHPEVPTYSVHSAPKFVDRTVKMLQN